MTDFAASFGVGLFDGRLQLKAALSAYAVHRSSGPLEARFAASTWNQSVSILSGFYRWAVDEGYATAEPFTYRQATTFFSGVPQQVRVNLARRRQPKEHVTVKHLADDTAELFLLGLAGWTGPAARCSRAGSWRGTSAATPTRQESDYAGGPDTSRPRC
ncbi:hypothetical protein [Kitasatospora sp. MBT63]|uniref:hypothetical protein n=1 Tax=Kitasatospora sp. MBT63 TaxID=1444768 RepID=UPI00053A85E8|nr:hypothetical protein [Kitasatospora sp. MBT63]